jgi:transposase
MGVVATDKQALIEYVEEIPGCRHVCLEEGEQSRWVVEILGKHVDEIVVVQPERRRGAKNDRLDAFGLAEILRTRRACKRVYKDPFRFRDVWERARVYRMLTGDVVRLKNRVKSFYRGRGIPCGQAGVYKRGTREKYMKRLPASTRRVLEAVYQELDEVTVLQQEAQKKLIQASQRYRIARILETAPGFGPVRVAQMLPIVVTPHRFRRRQQFWSYCGLGIVTRSSSDYIRSHDGEWDHKPLVQTRGLKRDCNTHMKAIFKGAATSVCARMTSDPLYEHYHALLEKGVRPNLAKLTIARKIAAIVLVMWKQERSYDPQKQRSLQAPG